MSERLIGWVDCLSGDTLQCGCRSIEVGGLGCCLKEKDTTVVVVGVM